MKRASLVFGLAMVLAACGGAEEDLDAPAEAPLAGGEEIDGEGETDASSEDAPEDDAETSEATDEPEQAEATLTAIPSRYHGKWDTPGADCGEFEYSESRTEISANEIFYIESSVEVVKVSAEGKHVLVDGKMNEPGDGPQLAVTERLSLMTTPQGLRLQITDGTKPKGADVYELSRCE